MKKLFMFAASLMLFLTSYSFAQQPATLVNSGSYTPGNQVTPNSVGSLFGNGLAVNTVGATSLPLPTTLDNVTVTIANTPAGLFFVSPYQINLHVPSFIGFGSQPVVVKRNGVVTHTGTVTISQLVPGFFLQGTTDNLDVNVGYISDFFAGAYTNTNFWTFNAQGFPVIRSIPNFVNGHTYYIIAYLTGAFYSNTQNKVFYMENVATGQAVLTPMDYSGSSLSSPGLDQINVKLNNSSNTGYIAPSGLYRCYAGWSNGGGAPYTYSTNAFYILIP